MVKPDVYGDYRGSLDPVDPPVASVAFEPSSADSPSELTTQQFHKSPRVPTVVGHDGKRPGRKIYKLPPLPLGKKTPTPPSSVEPEEPPEPPVDSSPATKIVASKRQLKMLEGTSTASSKKSRRTSHQKQLEDSKVASMKAIKKEAHKVATRALAANWNKPVKERKTAREIVDGINRRFGSNLNSITIRRYVNRGDIGTSPLNYGPTFKIPPYEYEVLKGAFSSQLKLVQAEGKKQLYVKAMVDPVRKCVEPAGINVEGEAIHHLIKKLKTDTADEFLVGAARKVEQRRNLWTTVGNLSLWFDTWQELLLRLGFAVLKAPTDTDTVGDLVFGPGQTR
jgi:hypothetical protein